MHSQTCCLAGVCLLLSIAVFGQQTSQPVNSPSADDQYVPGPDSLPQPGVPKGKTFEFTFDTSRIFPGTTRTITVYVPAEYRAEKPACVYVGLDALGFEVPVVFDNLIYKNEMPVTIGIGVSPGTVASNNPPSNPRFNRSYEFDGLNANLARFLLEEVFPEVERRKTPDGLPIILSKDPNDHAAGGGSTGGIGSFTLAWERPDAFRRVFIAIGTFVGMRGGDHYAVLVRKTEPKPIRVFMQDGSNDQLTDFLGEVGDWWLSNQTMYSALRFAGYDVEHVWGEGTHSGKHATVIFPDAMRWLWKDWPQPVTAGQSKNVFLKAILQPGEDWQLIGGDYQSAGILGVDPEGNVVLRDSRPRKSWKITADGHLTEYLAIRQPYAGLAFGPDGRAFVTNVNTAKVVAFSKEGRSSTIAKDIRGTSLVVTHGGLIYVVAPGVSHENAGKLWLLKPDGKKLQLDAGLCQPSGIALSPDGLWLAVAENKTHWGYSYRVQPDGTLKDKERFYWFHVPDDTDDSGAGAWVMDRDGRLYAATRMGVQVFDRNGRSRLIMPVPGGEATGLTFGGKNFDTLYVSCGDHKVYRRKLKTVGAKTWDAPIALPPWVAG
jgi:gluconolactonase